MAWEVLDAAELRKNRMRREGHRRIEWRVSLRTQMAFRDLLAELIDLESEPFTQEVESRMESLREEIRRLPDFPKRYHPEHDVIVPVVTSMQR